MGNARRVDGGKDRGRGKGRFSYGYRPGRSQHKALDALAVALRKKVSWVLDADIRSFFDTIDHGCLQQFIEHRIGDKRMVRLLMKWVRAGVMEEGKLDAVEAGTPQGGIISPLMANIYLHYVFDLWVCQWRKRKAHGEVYVVRYADDVVMGFQFERDAIALRAALAERLARFNLELHPEKTRVLDSGVMPDGTASGEGCQSRKRLRMPAGRPDGLGDAAGPELSRNALVLVVSDPAPREPSAPS